jgi:hypothetical protein
VRAGDLFHPAARVDIVRTGPSCGGSASPVIPVDGGALVFGWHATTAAARHAPDDHAKRCHQIAFRSTAFTMLPQDAGPSSTGNQSS